ncbi:hypothetical protein Hanom_Chr00s006441g01733961 [Helianthus anomalus]
MILLQHSPTFPPRFVVLRGRGVTQNLQLHRRGHNLPWKLKQRTGNEIRKRVYVCPEPSCVHHDPKRALGDLTGIKKHFSRNYGEKKWKCEQCSKKYAVQCDCGTLFSRRDSFITHRAFCDALAVETAKGQPEDEPLKKDEDSNPKDIESTLQSTTTTSSPPPLLPPTASPAVPVTSSVMCIADSPSITAYVFKVLTTTLIFILKLATKVWFFFYILIYKKIEPHDFI